VANLDAWRRRPADLHHRASGASVDGPDHKQPAYL